MTNLLHQLRTRSSAISRSLLLVLLASWLSMFCMPCVTPAEAAPVSTSTMPCHGPQAPADQMDVCPHAHAGSCLDGDCGVVMAVPQAEPATALLALSTPEFFLLPSHVVTALDDRPLPYRPGPLGLLVADDGPLYLRHCCFLK